MITFSRSLSPNWPSLRDSRRQVLHILNSCRINLLTSWHGPPENAVHHCCVTRATQKITFSVLPLLRTILVAAIAQQRPLFTELMPINGWSLYSCLFSGRCPAPDVYVRLHYHFQPCRQPQCPMYRKPKWCVYRLTFTFIFMHACMHTWLCTYAHILWHFGFWQDRRKNPVKIVGYVMVGWLQIEIGKWCARKWACYDPALG
jgi:hypothetical protein